MAKLSVLFLSLSGLLMVTAIPQYSQSDVGSAPPPPPPPPPSASLPSYTNSAPGGSSSSFPSSSSSFQSSSQGSSNNGGSRQGGDLTVQCRASPDGSGSIKYDCSGVNKDAITLKTEHFLWLENQGRNSQNLDIEIPNYNIDEFIKAAYKGLGPQEGARINILLKKPDVTYNAAKDEGQNQQVGQPAVSVNYQPVEKVSVHYPTQKGYSNGGGSGSSSGGISSSSSSSSSFNSGSSSSSNFGSSSSNFPSASASAPVQASQVSSGSGAPARPAGSGAYSRPQRESGYRYYFIRQ